MASDSAMDAERGEKGGVMVAKNPKYPWIKFYPSDWRADQALRVCSIGARGLWLEMLCVMHEADPYGHLVVNGSPVTDAQLGMLAGIPLVELGALLTELETAGVFSRTRAGVIVSRRLTRDERRRKDGEKAAKSGTLSGSRRHRQSVEIAQQNQPPPVVVNGVAREPPHPPEARSQKPDNTTSSTSGDCVAARDSPNDGDDDVVESRKLIEDSDDPYAKLAMPPHLDRRPGALNETVPPNLTAQRESLISQAMGLHISRANAEAMIGGAIKVVGLEAVKAILDDAVLHNLDRDKLREKIANQVSTMERAAAKEPALRQADVDPEDAEAWERIRQRLRAEKGEGTYRGMIAPLQLEAVNGVTVTLAASTSFTADYATKEFGPRLTELWQEQRSSIETVTIEAPDA